MLVFNRVVVKVAPSPTVNEQQLEAELPGLLGLAPDERILGRWRAGPEDSGRGGDQGYLVLTSARCVFVRSTHGKSHRTPVKYKVEPKYSYRLEEISDPTLRAGYALDFLTVGWAEFLVDPSVGPTAREYIAAARTVRVQTLAAARAGSPPVVREVVREVVKVPCRYCGMLLIQTDRRCPGCGAPVT